MKRDARHIILDNAAKVFSQYGYKKTTINDIARTVGKGKSSVYYYFESKEDIFMAIVQNEVELLREELQQVVSKYIEPTDKLKAYILNRMKIYKKASRFYKSITIGLHHQLDFVSEIIKKHEALELDILQHIIEEGCKAKQFVVAKPRFAALAIDTALKSLDRPLQKGESEGTIDVLTNQLTEVLLMGIVSRKV